MKKTFIALSLIIVSIAANAGPACTAPQDKWMQESAFKAKVEKDGYTIKTFKVSKGSCYEIYGFDKGGNKVEIYFDPVTGAIIEQK